MKPPTPKAVHSGRAWESMNPWYRSYMCSKQRCERKQHPSYVRYGGAGIKFLMTVDDFKALWFRDKAYLMKRPSIDRIDTQGNYETKNCRFLEMSENRSRQKRDYSSLKKRIIQKTKNGDVVKIWESIKEAEAALKTSHIYASLKGINKTAAGFVWEYYPTHIQPKKGKKR